MLEDAAVPVLLTQSHLLDRLPGHEALTVLLDAAAQEAEPLKPLHPVSPDLAAYVIFTSGSTGRPKGAVNSHRGIVNRIFWIQSEFGLTAYDRALHKAPFSFDLAVWEILWPLAVGARLVIARPGGDQDPAYLVDTIHREGVTTIHYVPSMLQVFVEQPGVERCGSLRKIIAGGEALPPTLADRVFARLPQGLELYNHYGPTETAVAVTQHICRPGEERVPIGRPVANTHAHLLDRQGNPAPVHVAGELHIGGAQLGRGYLRRPDLTADRFVPDPFTTPGARLYRTGDLARRLPDGEIEYLGRIDHQVKIRGFRIELGEIEAVLARFPGVREAAVVPWDAGVRGRQLAAYIGCDPDHAPTPGELRSFLKGELPDYMIPAAFVPLATLPQNASGKLDRSALPSPRPGSTPEGRVPPRTPLEEVLCGIMAEVLGLDEVGALENFFDLGGHSLLALQMLSLVRETFGIEIAVAHLFESPTVAGLAACLTAEPERRQRIDAVMPILLEMTGEAESEVATV
jgi:amino acid adenylation domain-containing protein